MREYKFTGNLIPPDIFICNPSLHHFVIDTLYIVSLCCTYTVNDNLCTKYLLGHIVWFQQHQVCATAFGFLVFSALLIIGCNSCCNYRMFDSFVISYLDFYWKSLSNQYLVGTKYFNIWLFCLNFSIFCWERTIEITYHGFYSIGRVISINSLDLGVPKWSIFDILVQAPYFFLSNQTTIFDVNVASNTGQYTWSQTKAY